MKDHFSVFVDSDIFVALAVQTDALHEKTLSIIRQVSGKSTLFITSNYVFAESVTVIS